MKRLICVFICLSAVVSAWGQKTKAVYAGDVAVGMNCGVSKDMNSNSAYVTTTHGAYVTQDLFLGLGTGLDYELSGLIRIPLYAEARFNIVECLRFTPYLSCRIGGDLVAVDVEQSRTGGGIMVSPAAGIDFGRYSFRLSYQYGAGSLSQKIDRDETLVKDYEAHYLGVSFLWNFGKNR